MNLDYLKERFKDILNFQKYSTVWLAVIVIIAGILTTYFYIQSERAKKMLKNPNAAAQEQIKSIVNKVSKLIELPDDETPTVATVSDVEKLNNQPFFRMAQNGDKVLIYSKLGKAVLYRPSTNKIIEFAPIATEGKPTNDVKLKRPDFKGVRVAIYNGSGKVGLAASTEEKIRELYPEIEVVTKENAAKEDYKENLVIDISGKKQTQSAELARILEGKTGSLPEGELEPEADILIIVAK